MSISQLSDIFNGKSWQGISIPLQLALPSANAKWKVKALVNRVGQPLDHYSAPCGGCIWIEESRTEELAAPHAF